ncbi:MAG: helix-turn-helix transcriptional regulator [Patescibacteria group bacterium]
MDRIELAVAIEVGCLLRRRREEQEKSVEELAIAIEADMETVRQIEAGELLPTLMQFLKAAKFLGIEIIPYPEN